MDSGTAFSSLLLAARITRDRSVSDSIMSKNDKELLDRRRIVSSLPNNNNNLNILPTIPEKVVWRHVFADV